MNPTFRFNKADGTIDELTHVKLEVIAFFSDDRVSISQAFQVFETELASYKSDPASWQFSALSMSVINSVAKRAAQVHVCGIVALIMCHLNKDGSPASLNQASEIASEIFNNSGKISFVIPKAKSWEVQEKAVVGDPFKIRQYFRKYRSAAHICAAKVLAGANSSGHPLIKPLPSTLTYLSTVLHYQRVFQSWERSDNWGLWELWQEGDTFEKAYPHLQPQEGDLTAIRANGRGGAV
ncbi:hypothetical protein [Roseobacter sp. OBYS 0001]|uniref:hypothetical protein n=1 Tax=Roseobacter sp. OBYS 0001 TaxID=882651 RepID=UPI001BC358F5|nr:hypothetical protein [Roseobacter sp. OBYS 0001]GIT85015.1 hypothetical protein ROBYS_00310 [Roseobacter sp. OBYS 0001]